MSRIGQETDLLRQVVSNLEVSEDGNWILIPGYQLPSGWEPAQADIAIFFRPGYEQCGLYGIYVRAEPKFQSQSPNNCATASDVPFSGEWTVFSWELDGWNAQADLHKGTNVVNWYYGIAERFKAGV